jgi:hypothetical protein
MQNAIKLENISNLITSPSSYQCRKSMTSCMKVSDFAMLCISIILPTRIEIIHGKDSLYNKGNIIFA